VVAEGRTKIECLRIESVEKNQREPMVIKGEFSKF